MDPLVLATDLDGTLAAGTPADRAALFALLDALPDTRLIYVTGRTPDAARRIMTEAGLRAPDVTIADVGTSVLRGAGPARVGAIEAELGRDWPGAAAIRARLDTLPGLSAQDVRAPRRVSCWIEPVRRQRAAAAGGATDEYAARSPADVSFGSDAAAVAAALARRATAALHGFDVDVIVSGNVFLDVLPRGVNKGTTLRRVLHWLGEIDDRCVVAGDSLNDLALFSTGLRAIAVGNCEPALRERVARERHVYCAAAVGAAGIFEGLRHYGYVAGGKDRPRHGE